MVAGKVVVHVALDQTVNRTRSGAEGAVCIDKECQYSWTLTVGFRSQDLSRFAWLLVMATMGICFAVCVSLSPDEPARVWVSGPPSSHHARNNKPDRCNQLVMRNELAVEHQTVCPICHANRWISLFPGGFSLLAGQQSTSSFRIVYNNQSQQQYWREWIHFPGIILCSRLWNAPIDSWRIQTKTTVARICSGQ